MINPQFINKRFFEQEPEDQMDSLIKQVIAIGSVRKTLKEINENTTNGSLSQIIRFSSLEFLTAIGYDISYSGYYQKEDLSYVPKPFQHCLCSISRLESATVNGVINAFKPKASYDNGTYCLTFDDVVIKYNEDHPVHAIYWDGKCIGVHFLYDVSLTLALLHIISEDIKSVLMETIKNC